MPSALPDGERPPDDGSLPEAVVNGAQDRALGVYIHVPFCSKRCGYCDFNTYTAAELGGGADQAAYAETAGQELALAAQVLTRAGLPRRPVSTIFFGGGTPTLLPPDDLATLISAIRERWGLVADPEVTVEANPDSVTAESLDRLARAGVTRVSFGMQSAVPHVLAVLDRTHEPAAVARGVRWARQAGLAVSLDLIYGTPGESLDDWRTSLGAAIDLAPDHISAYALVVEDGTRLAQRVRRGEMPAPDEDDLADKYETADDLLAAAGFAWYEVSNWATSPAQACRHNLGYWRGDDWWGIGPGAHSHVGGVRWWNVKHPRAYAERLRAGVSPAQGREVLDAVQRHEEAVLLGVRLAEGLDTRHLHASDLDPAAGRRVADLVGDGLLVERVEGDPRGGGPRRRLVLTRRGRLLADAVVRALLE